MLPSHKDTLLLHAVKLMLSVGLTSSSCTVRACLLGKAPALADRYGKMATSTSNLATRVYSECKHSSNSYKALNILRHIPRARQRLSDIFLLSYIEMPGAGAGLAGYGNTNRVEAPVTLKAYLMCAFAAFGGIFFGYDSGYINGIMGMDYFTHEFGDSKGTIPSSTKSLIVSILSVGTFLGACK